MIPDLKQWVRCLLLTSLLAQWLHLQADDSTMQNEIRLTAPLDHQVVQRMDRWTGRVPIEGFLAGPAEARLTVEYRFLGEGLDDVWRPLTQIKRGDSKFQARVNLRAGGWYELELRVVRQNTFVAQTRVQHVGVGEVFVVAGQSNSANHGEERQEPRSGKVATFNGKAWVPSRDPQEGASGNGGSFIPPFADALVDQLQVPVGILATGVGATSVREWLPRGSRFPNPPTLTGNVIQLPSGGWESKGELFQRLSERAKALGPGGFRAVLWHQGESDANQTDSTRTLPGRDYEAAMEKLIREFRREVRWEAPWFVAQVSYHTPEDPGSPDIRAAQESLWKSGTALQGPDTDALAGPNRDAGGKGVHFSGAGLREHGRQWAAKVAPWLESRLSVASGKNTPANRRAPPRLDLVAERFKLLGRPAFILMPPNIQPGEQIPWIFYAPTLPGYPDEAERWMHEQFLSAGVAIAGIDVGEAYGSPQSHVYFNALYEELVSRRGFARKPCLFGRSRGGLWVGSWAVSNPSRVAGIIGIYPVYDFTTYPGLKNAAPAYGLSAAELEKRLPELNPIRQSGVLARAGIPVTLIHGDVDVVVPLKQNSAELVRQYRENQAESLVKLIVLKGQGHNFYEGFFHSQELVDFAIERAKAGISN